MIDRINATVSVKTLTPTQAAAVQYRQLSLTAGSRALINPKMISLKKEIAADPDLALSLKISEAAQQFATGGTQAAVDLMQEAKTEGTLSPAEELLSLQIAFGDFGNHSYQRPEAFRAKLRPALQQIPDDIPLLLMMAVSGVGDLRDGNTILSPDAQAALNKLESLEVSSKHQPLITLPLVNLYASQGNNKAALYHLYRAKTFQSRNAYELNSITNQLEARLKDEATSAASP